MAYGAHRVSLRCLVLCCYYVCQPTVCSASALADNKLQRRSFKTISTKKKKTKGNRERKPINMVQHRSVHILVVFKVNFLSSTTVVQKRGREFRQGPFFFFWSRIDGSRARPSQIKTEHRGWHAAPLLFLNMCSPQLLCTMYGVGRLCQSHQETSRSRGNI